MTAFDKIQDIFKTLLQYTYVIVYGIIYVLGMYYKTFMVIFFSNN